MSTLSRLSACAAGLKRRRDALPMAAVEQRQFFQDRIDQVDAWKVHHGYYHGEELRQWQARIDLALAEFERMARG